MLEKSLTEVVVVFQAIGRDEQITALDSLTNTPLYDSKQKIVRDGSVEDFTALLVVNGVIDEDRGVELALTWIKQHHAILRTLDAEKTIEIQTAIAPPSGSKCLALPAPFIELLTSIKAKLLHQYIRVVSDVELEQLRREGRGPLSDKAN